MKRCLAEAPTSLVQYPFSIVQKAFLAYAYKHFLSVAAWRLPHHQQQHVILDLSGKSQRPASSLESLPSGFIARPFAGEAFFLKADIHYQSGEETVQTVDSSASATETAAAITSLTSQSPNPSSLPYPTLENALAEDTSKGNFTHTVTDAIAAIEQGHFHKVVPSRQKQVPLPSDFDLADTFQQLCERYPTAFVSLFSIPGVGTWLGASPETLVHTQDNIFRTMALAGTQVGQGQHPREAIWRQKEIEEQAMVSRYIINCFKKIRLREFEEIGPKTVAAGNLLHLRTDFQVDMAATNFPELGSVMLDLLHPTSAVCGMPQEPALDFLRKHEDYDRAFYSGYLGPVNIENETNIFVNLRCMQLLSQKAILYAGAGVTIDSDPEKEWQETEMKLQTLLNVLQ